MSELRWIATTLMGILVLSLGCAALNSELTIYMNANNDSLMVILFAGLAGLVLVVLSLPAIVYLSLVKPSSGQLNFDEAWIWDDGGWSIFSYAWPLIAIIALMWATPLLRFVPELVATITTALSPSQEARRADHGGSEKTRRPMDGLNVPRIHKEDAERADLAAELDEAVADLERKKHELRQQGKHQD